MIIGVVLAILAPIVAQLIHFAISRKREFLADASGALLTLSRRSCLGAGKNFQRGIPMRRANNATAHLFIANPFAGKNGLSRLFLTHPPMEERVKALRA